MPTATQVTEYRRDQAALTTLALSDLAVYWTQFNTANAAREGLINVLPQLVRLYGAAAATLAADWYDDIRDTDGAVSRFSAIPFDLDDFDTGTDELARWGIDPLFRAEPDWKAAQSLVDGGLQRRIANVGRDTITASAIADPDAVGWKRIGTGACAFCLMLIERDELYTEATADFASHDHCNCQAYPLIKGSAAAIDVKDYVQTSRTITPADRARVREYLRDHPVT